MESNINNIWIFQSNRTLSPLEREYIKDQLNAFIENWDVHGEPIDAELKIIEERFIIVRTKEGSPSPGGCSLDLLNRKVKGIDELFNLELLNRFLVSYEFNGEIFTEHIKDFKNKIKIGRLKPENLQVFDISVGTYENLKNQFKKPLYESWAKNF